MNKLEAAPFAIMLASCVIAFFVADETWQEAMSSFLGVIVCCAWFSTDAICKAIREGN